MEEVYRRCAAEAAKLYPTDNLARLAQQQICQDQNTRVMNGMTMSLDSYNFLTGLSIVAVVILIIVGLFVWVTK